MIYKQIKTTLQKKIPFLFNILYLIKYRKLTKTIIMNFSKLFYGLLNSFKITKLYKTSTGLYYLPFLSYKDTVRRKIINNEIYEKEIVDIAAECIEPNSIVLDIGANFGQMSILFSETQRNVKVFAFEAQKYVFELLEKNVKVNDKKNIKCFYNLVGSKSGIENIKINKLYKFGSWGANNIEYSSNKQRSTKIEAIKIDDIKFDQTISFMKVDVQGLDLDVLKGAKNTIKYHRMPIIFEYESIFENIYDYKFDDIEKILNEINYEVKTKIGNDFLIIPS